MTNRLLQVFLSPAGRGVFEVSADPRGGLHCTCPGSRVRASCKHLDFVRDRLRENGGEYTIEVPVDRAVELVHEALESPSAFREFVLRFGTVEVI